MTTLVRRRTNPVAEMLAWLDSELTLSQRAMGLGPIVRVEEFVEDGEFVVRAELPGIDPEKNLDVSVEGDLLTIRGERSDERKEEGRSEFHYGSFARRITMPQSAKTDDLTAEYSDGVLTVKVPIDGTTEAPHKVEVLRPAS